MESKTAKHIKRIGIIGPESTGKTWLSKQLAIYFDGIFVEEYAREYLGGLGRAYNCKDIEELSQHQLRLENLAAQKAKHILFADTTLHISKIWMINSCNYCPQWIEHFLQKPHYDLILLLMPDLPWQPDPLREHPNLKDRQHFFELYQTELQIQSHTPWHIVSGIGNKRLQNAIEAVFLMVNG